MRIRRLPFPPVLESLTSDIHTSGLRYPSNINPPEHLRRSRLGTNIASTRTDRYWAHLCLSVVVVLWVCRVFWYETRCYTRLRQKRMMSQLRKASGTTILVTDIPENLLSKEHLKRLYDIYPGGVRRVWLQRDYSKLKQKIQEREEWALTGSSGNAFD